MLPKADIPMVQLSLQSNLDQKFHVELGKAIAPLREEGVLIVGSGSATHNFGELHRGSSKVIGWAKEFVRSWRNG